MFAQGCLGFTAAVIFLYSIYIEYSYSIRITIENNFYCIPETWDPKSVSPPGAVIFIIQLLIIQDFLEVQILWNGRRDCIKFFWTVPNRHLET